jgi:hypothetical protein
MSKRKRKTTRKKIHQLEWAKFTTKGMPSPKHKAGSFKKKGVMYEKRVADYCRSHYGGRVSHGQWIKFEDERGAGKCQPDILILPRSKEDPIVIIECKLTWKKGVEDKIKGVYGTCIKDIFPGYKVRYIQACKRLSRSFKGVIIDELPEAFSPDLSPDYVTINLREIAEI